MTQDIQSVVQFCQNLVSQKKEKLDDATFIKRLTSKLLETFGSISVEKAVFEAFLDFGKKQSSKMKDPQMHNLIMSFQNDSFQKTMQCKQMMMDDMLVIQKAKTDCNIKQSKVDIEVKQIQKRSQDLEVQLKDLSSLKFVTDELGQKINGLKEKQNDFEKKVENRVQEFQKSSQSISLVMTNAFEQIENKLQSSNPQQQIPQNIVFNISKEIVIRNKELKAKTELPTPCDSISLDDSLISVKEQDKKTINTDMPQAPLNQNVKNQLQSLNVEDLKMQMDNQKLQLSTSTFMKTRVGRTVSSKNDKKEIGTNDTVDSTKSDANTSFEQQSVDSCTKDSDKIPTDRSSQARCVHPQTTTKFMMQAKQKLNSSLIEQSQSQITEYTESTNQQSISFII